MHLSDIAGLKHSSFLNIFCIFFLTVLTAPALSAAKGSEAPNFSSICPFYASALSSSRSLSDFINLIPLSDGQREDARRDLNESELNSASIWHIFSFACQKDLLTITNKDSNQAISIDFAFVAQNQVLINGERQELKRDESFAKLKETVRSAFRKKVSMDVRYRFIIDEAFAESAETPQWRSKDILLPVPGSDIKVPYTISALVLGSAPELKFVCEGEPSVASVTNDSVKKRLAFLSQFNLSSGLKRAVLGCAQSTTGDMLRYMSGFKNFSFSCEDRKIKSIDFIIDDYLDHSKEKKAPSAFHLSFDYQNNILRRVRKTGNNFAEPCISTFLNNGDIAQVQSSIRSAPYCASDDFYNEMRGSDTPSRLADIQVGRYSVSDALAHVNDSKLKAYQSAVEEKKADFNLDSKLEAIQTQLRGNLKRIDSITEDAKDKYREEIDRVRKLLCNTDDFEACRQALEDRAASDSRHVRLKLDQAIASVPKPTLSPIKNSDKTAIFIPTKMAFFEPEYAAVSDRATVQTLPKHRKLKLQNLSPLANIALVQQCCSDLACYHEIEASRLPNGMTPNQKPGTRSDQ